MYIFTLTVSFSLHRKIMNSRLALALLVFQFAALWTQCGAGNRTWELFFSFYHQKEYISVHEHLLDDGSCVGVCGRNA